jgi:hypothetical protein
MPKREEDHDGVDLSPDRRVEEVLGSHGEPRNLVELVGFLGDSPERGRHRLFTDAALRCWLDICDDDIVYRQKVRAEDGAYGGRSVLLVKVGAVMFRGAVTTAEAESDYLCCPDQEGPRCKPDEVLVCRALDLEAGTSNFKSHSPNCCGKYGG